MKPIALALFAAAALAPHVAFSATVLAQNSSSFSASSNGSFSVIDERHLQALTVDTICKKKDNTPLVGRRQLHGEPFELGAVYARCDKDHKPTCYMDDGTIDRRSSDEEVDCSVALKDMPKAKTTGGRDLATAWERERLWPKGVVCYNLMNADDPAVEAKLTAAKKAELSKMIEDVMKRYENGGPAGGSADKKTNVRFMHIDNCMGLGICNGCKHFVNFEFEVRAFDANHFNPDTPDEQSCWSYVGYRPGLSTQLENGDQFMRKLLDPLGDKSKLKKLRKRMNDVLLRVNKAGMTYQPLNLSPACWTEDTIAHEIGHTLGLQHDHQRRDREVMMKTVKIFKQLIPKDKVDDPVAQRGVFKDFEILDPDWWHRSMCGEYQKESIMHYDDAYMCLTPEDIDPKDFCDVGEETGTKREGAPLGCMRGNEIFCAAKEKQKPLERGPKYQPTEKDYEMIRNMYSASPRSCTIQ